jgi:hypothetical protein
MMERLLGRRGACAAALLLFVAAIAGGCAYRGRDDALSQRFTWFSYMNGDDIRAGCAPGALDRYRFVYNGIYIKQARTYDIAPAGNAPAQAGGYLVRARVLGPSDLSTVGIDPGRILGDPLDILAPFAGRKASLPLSGRDIDALDQALARSGFFQPAPEGLYLRSDDFFWLAVACVNGRLAFNTWKYPSPGFDALTFPSLLYSWDETGVPVNPARALTPFDIYGEASARDQYPRFTLTVGENGLRGTGTLF